MFLIVGLGNPGREYENTRHNVGFMTIDKIADKLNISLKKKGFRSIYGEGRFNGEKIVLAKPETFMNNSGWAVLDLINWYKVPHDRLVVLYDDIDIPCGTLRIRSNGSAGTHNGMRSIVSCIGFEDFPRVRIGIGKPEHGLIDHVLGVPSDEDRAKLITAFSNAAEAVLMIVDGEFDSAQSKFNYKPPKKVNNSKRKNNTDKMYLPVGEISEIKNAKEVFFVNAKANCANIDKSYEPLIDDAEVRLRKFAPLIKKVFPETRTADGIIESPLTETKKLRRAVNVSGRLFIKQDSELPIAGSVKARGGIYEVLKHTEELAVKNGLIRSDEDYERLDEHKSFFKDYFIHVGSTGNLGLSIGITAAAIGYNVTVHMSSDAKEWKKELLRKNGVAVIEYESDYQTAVEQGRLLAGQDEKSYFIDDENSIDLFLGYATAARRLKSQIDELNITVDEDNPLFVYLPCGVGGAPGGIAYGLKLIFGDAVKCFFVEPVQAACMLAAFYKDECVPVSSLGLSGGTAADGLAVGRASGLVYKIMKPILDGEFTVEDSRLIPYLRLIYGTEGIFVEPSAAISLAGVCGMTSPEGEAFLKKTCTKTEKENIVHVLWATGGRLVPKDERHKLLKSSID